MSPKADKMFIGNIRTHIKLRPNDHFDTFVVKPVQCTCKLTSHVVFL